MMKYNFLDMDDRIYHVKSLEYTMKQQGITENAQQTLKAKTGTKISVKDPHIKKKVSKKIGESKENKENIEIYGNYTRKIKNESSGNVGSMYDDK